MDFEISRVHVAGAIVIGVFMGILQYNCETPDAAGGAATSSGQQAAEDHP